MAISKDERLRGVTLAPLALQYLLVSNGHGLVYLRGGTCALWKIFVLWIVPKSPLVLLIPFELKSATFLVQYFH